MRVQVAVSITYINADMTATGNDRRIMADGTDDGFPRHNVNKALIVPACSIPLATTNRTPTAKMLVLWRPAIASPGVIIVQSIRTIFIATMVMSGAPPCVITTRAATVRKMVTIAFHPLRSENA